MDGLKLRQVDPETTTDNLVPRTSGGRLVLGPAPKTGTLLPLTTTVTGEPALVWDSNDELVLTEVTL